MIIRIEKPLLESMHLLRAVPKADWREQLVGITFEKGGTIWAGNGHVALVGRTAIPIERDIVLNIEKTPAAAKKYHFAILDTQQGICSFIPAFDGMEEASDEDCINRRLGVVKVAEISATRVIKLASPIPPVVEKVDTIVFDADYLAILPKIADLFQKQEGGKFAFNLTGSNTAALIKVRAGQDYKLTVIMMPIVV
jgi:hypothetical protein